MGKDVLSGSTSTPLTVIVRFDVEEKLHKLSRNDDFPEPLPPINPTKSPGSIWIASKPFELKWL